MKNLSNILLPLALLCLLGACAMAVVNGIAVIAAAFGFERPFKYFEYLRIPLWSVALPTLSILALLPLALRQAFTQESAAEEEDVVEPMNWRRVIERWRSRFHLRPA